MEPGVDVLASFQHLFTTGKPDGDPFSKTISSLNSGVNSYTVDMPQSGDYLMNVCHADGSSWSQGVKVTVK